MALHHTKKQMADVMFGKLPQSLLQPKALCQCPSLSTQPWANHILPGRKWMATLAKAHVGQSFGTRCVNRSFGQSPSPPFAEVLKYCREYKNKYQEGQRFDDISEGLQAETDYKKPVMVIFLGATSAGKSTLINTLIGETRCPVGIKPTTQKLQEILWGSILLVDSPGLDAMKQDEQKKAMDAAHRADLAVVMTSANQPLRE